MYQIEGDANLQQYTPKQLGPYVELPVSSRAGERFDLVVLDNGTTQVLVMSGCSAQACRTRTVEMVRAGVDPHDIKGVGRNGLAPRVFGPGLIAANQLLWWTPVDARLLAAERERAAAAASLPTGEALVKVCILGDDSVMLAREYDALSEIDKDALEGTHGGVSSRALWTLTQCAAHPDIDVADLTDDDFQQVAGGPPAPSHDNDGFTP